MWEGVCECALHRAPTTSLLVAFRISTARREHPGHRSALLSSAREGKRALNSVVETFFSPLCRHQPFSHPPHPTLQNTHPSHVKRHDVLHKRGQPPQVAHVGIHEPTRARVLDFDDRRARPPSPPMVCQGRRRQRRSMHLSNGGGGQGDGVDKGKDSVCERTPRRAPRNQRAADTHPPQRAGFAVGRRRQPPLQVGRHIGPGAGGHGVKHGGERGEPRARNEVTLCR